MNYCVRCGNKLKKDSKFCSKCGSKIISGEKKNISTKKNEENKEKLLLTIGTLLIIIASIIFAFANWNEMTSILKILFLAIESLLYLSISLFSKKLDYKMPYKFLWFLGIAFIPMILNLIGTDKLLGDYLSYNGNGIFVYLSISFLICFIIYFLSHIFLKSNLFLYFSYIWFYLMIISVLGIFNLDNTQIAIPILNIFDLLIVIIVLFIKQNNFNKTIKTFISVEILFNFMLTIIYSFIDTNIILQCVTYISLIVTLMILIFKLKRNILKYIYPLLIYMVIIFGIPAIFENDMNIILFLSILSIITIFFIINIIENSILRNITYIFMLLFILFISLIYNTSYLTTIICSVIMLIISIFIIKINQEKIQSNISKILLPIIILIIIYSLINWFFTINVSLIYLIVSIICFTIYIIYNHKKLNIFTKNTFKIYSYAYLIISSIIILITKPLVLAFILNEMAWLYYFIYSKLIKDHKAINVWILIMLIINFILLSIRYSLSMYYSFIFIAIITSILDFVELKLKNNKSIYIYISIIMTSIASITDISNKIIFAIGLNVLVYAFTYYLAIKKHNVNFVIKYFYTLIGFVLINSIFNYFVDSHILANILILVTYLIILISMFLLEVDEDRKIFSYSIVISYPYLKLIDLVDYLNIYSTTLIVLLLVLLILIYFERVFSLKEKDRIIFELVFLSIIHLFTLTDMLIFNFILAVFYIFYGFYKKRGPFTVFGTILLIVTLLFNIFKIFNNISVTYVLLFIGVIMLTYVFYMEGKKKKK